MDGGNGVNGDNNGSIPVGGRPGFVPCYFHPNYNAWLPYPPPNHYAPTALQVPPYSNNYYSSYHDWYQRYGSAHANNISSPGWCSKSNSHNTTIQNKRQRISNQINRCSNQENNNSHQSSFRPLTTDGRVKFEVDSRHLNYATLGAAYAALFASDGGYSSNQRLLLVDRTYSLKRPEGIIEATKYYCSWESKLSSGEVIHRCKWKAEIRRIPSCNSTEPRFVIYKHKFDNSHCHEISPQVDDPSKSRGIDPLVKVVVDEFIGKEIERGVSILSLKPMRVLSDVITIIKKSTDECLAHIQRAIRDKDSRERLGSQIRGLVYRSKEAFIRQKLGGDRTIANNDSLIRVLKLFQFNLPVNYRVKSTFKSPLDIADALGVTDDHMFIVNLSHGSIFNTFRFDSRAVKQNSASQRKFEEQTEQGFLVISPTGLFQLLTLAKRRHGTRCISSDGSGGTCKDGSTFVTMGTPAVKLIRDSKTQVRSSLRSICYLHLGGERYYPYCLALFNLRRLCSDLFGLTLLLDWGCSDHSDVFINAHRFYKRYSSLCDSTKPPAVSIVPPKYRTSSGTFTEYKDVVLLLVLTCSHFNVLKDQMSKNSDSIPIQITQDDTECSGLSLGLSTVPSFTISELEAALNCFFHVMQNFKKNASFVLKFVDVSLRSSTGIAYVQVNLIHFCKTPDQRSAVTNLVLSHWRDILGETVAADHFEKEYCSPPYWNWNYAATGEVGVYPTNCPNESLNKLLKTKIQLNVNLPRLLVQSLPELLKEDSNLRNDGCTIDIPTDCTRQTVAITGFMEEGLDIIPDGRGGYYGNKGAMIGIPLCVNRLEKMRHSLKGLSYPFYDKNATDNLPGSIAQRMVDATRSICHVTLNDEGKYVGDCKNCYIRLGRGCNVATFIRNKHHHLSTSLNDMRKVPVKQYGTPYKSQNKGTSKKMYRSGPSSRKIQAIRPMTSDFPSYLSSLDDELLSKVVGYLGLVQTDQLGDDDETDDVCETGGVCSRKYGRHELLQLLHEFRMSPATYRSNKILN